MPNKQNYILLSYIPLLTNNAAMPRNCNDINDLVDIFIAATEKYNPPDDGCVVWTRTGDVTQPTLAKHRAAELHKHILQWSSGRPEEWFKLCYQIGDDGCSFILLPDIMKSIDRFKFYANNSNDIDQITVVSVPLAIHCIETPKYDECMQSMPPIIDFNLVDPNDIHDNKISRECIYPIGKIKCEEITEDIKRCLFVSENGLIFYAKTV